MSIRRMVLGSAFLSLAACVDEGEPTGPHSKPSSRTHAVQGGTIGRPNVDPFERLASDVPEFGGLYLEADPEAAVKPGKRRLLNLYLKPGGNRDNAISKARAFLAERRIEVDGVRILPAVHTFSELITWKREIKDVLGVEGVVMLDLDEARNDLFVGVRDANATAAVRLFLRGSDLPMSAIRIGIVPPIRNGATLQDYRRPMEGGRQINYSSWTCSLGFNASLAGSFLFASESDRTFVTASHCTDTQGGVEQTAYYQGGYFVGTEIQDPSYFTGGDCPVNRVCRYSDAAMVDYDESASWEPAGVARVSSGITISTTQPIVIIYAEAVAVVNSYVGKLGRTTGYTSGPVTSTCFDGNVSDSNVTQLCQVVAQATMVDGDSGGPALAYYLLYPGVPNSAWGANLYGVAWGAFADTAFIYSPMSAVHDELGFFGAICVSSWFC